MQRRAAALAAVLALITGGGVASAGSATTPAAPAASPPAADVRRTPAHLQRTDLRSGPALVAAYRSVLATRLTQSGEGFLFYGGRPEALPVHDLDGDRADDVLEIRGNAVKGPAVAVRSGRTGRERWSASSASLAAAQFIAVPGGHPIVLTYALSEDGGDAYLAYAGTTTLTVEARDAASGALVWSKEWTGALTFRPVSAALVGLAYPGGVLATKAGQHPTLLIDSYDEVFTDVTETMRGSVEYVDAVTGASLSTTHSFDGDASFCPVDDLDGDGTDDVIEVVASGSVSALSGVDAHEIWTVDGPGQFDTGWADPSPDLSGDHHPDLLLGTMSYDDETGSVTALDGRTGKALWQRAGNGVARSVGDIDHDGRSDTRLLSYLGSAIRYTVVSGRGSTLWSTTVTNTVRGTGMLSWLAGDLDGDGIQDSYVRLVDRSDSGTSDGKGSFVVDGRSGRLTAHPDLGIPVGDSLDGHGDDLARTTTVLTGGSQRVLITLVDGRTGRSQWRRAVPVASSASLVDVWAGDFTGTGRADLLDVLAEPDRAVVVVQHGRTGRTTWSGDYDTRGGLKPF